ncbi:MAG: amidohydrolase family protein [Clostridia bacterium]|nr:amidohydrolase family protein [Clostridia bacterium]
MKKQALKGNILWMPSIGELKTVANGYLVTQNGKVEGVYETLPPVHQDAEVEDFGDALILPSFADIHFHAPQCVFQGLGTDLPLMDWLPKYAFPAEKLFSDAGLAREVYAELARDLVARGTTRVVAFSSLHWDTSLILLEEFEKAGLTGFAGKVSMDRNALPDYQEETDSAIADEIRFLDGAERFTRMKPIVTPRFTPACSDRLMEALGKIVRERDLPVQSHLSENVQEIETVSKLCPDCKEYWETYDRWGLLTDKTVMAHCVWCSPRERAALKERGTVVAHCPDSNITIMSGFPKVRTMLEEGLTVGLGSDVAGGTDFMMNRVMGHAIRMSKARRINSLWREEPLSVPEAFFLGTTSANRIFGLGTDAFAAGEPLHAVVIRDSDKILTRRLSLPERFERAIYLTEKSDITAVFSAGRRVK